MKYQYTTVSSNLESSDQQEFFLENDSLKITYSFSGYGGPVNISILNKLNTPLYVDWKRSALVLNDQSYTYWQNKSSLQASSDGYEIAWTPVVSSTSSTISGTIKGDEAIGFIPPNANKQASMVMLKPEFSKLGEPGRENRVKIQTKTGPSIAERYDYQKDKSPVKFRSFLTLSTEAAFAQPFTYESEFWVTEVIQSHVSPENYLDEKGDNNKFYNSKLTGAGTVLGVGALVVLGILLSGGN